MTCAGDFIYIDVTEDRSADIILRACAFGATGATSPVPKEGKLLLAADVTSMAVKAYNAAGTQNGTTLTITAITSPTLAATITTLQTTTIWLNIVDGLGGNVKFTAPATWFPDGDTTVTIEVTYTLTDASVITGRILKATVNNLVQS